MMTAAWGCRHNSLKENNNAQPWIELLRSGNQGLATSKNISITWIASTERLQAVQAELNKLQFTENPVSPPEIDFETHCALQLEMGRQPTAGYSLTFNESASVVFNSAAVIAVNWQVPSEGTVSAQVITSPYLLLQLKKGEFQSLAVVDQQNHTLFESAIPQECRLRYIKRK